MRSSLSVSFALFVSVLSPALVACSSGDDPAQTDDHQTENLDADRQAQLAKMIGANVDPMTAAESKSLAGDPNADFDQDGIPDVLEEELLRQYRPYYKFSKDGDKGEEFGPADAVAEITNSQLKQTTGDDGTTDPLSGCGRPGDQHLVPASSLLTCNPDTSYLAAKAVSTYCLNIADARYHGVSIDEAKAKATGFYGHVAKDTVNSHPAYKVEYWQFYAFNNQDITVLGLGEFGKHEGDWTGVSVWYDVTTKKIAKIEYLIHGTPIDFNIPVGATPTCSDCFGSMKGAHYNPNVGNFHDANERPAYNDNQAEFYMDAQAREHVVVYIERGGHETWPGAWGKAEIDLGVTTFYNGSHNGAGASYLVPDIADRPVNLGEVDHPLTPDARLILSFNGHWGCTNSNDLFGLAPHRSSPVGPSMHCEWKWPTGSGAAKGCEH